MLTNMVSIIFAFVLFVGVCSGAPGASVRGPTTIEAYPSLVQVERFDPKYNVWAFFCAGNILNENTILSAAHCFHRAYDEFYYPEFRRIRAGTTYPNRGGVVVNIANVLNHPNFHNDVDKISADINIIRLRNVLSFGNTINSISIVPQGWEIPNIVPVVQAGWGYNPLNPESDVLREATVYTVNCADHYQSVDQDTICAGVPGVGLEEGCPGIYGGPLYYNEVLVGVFSWGGCDDPNYPGVNTKVSGYTEWIVANVN